jgi:endonuclease III
MQPAITIDFLKKSPLYSEELGIDLGKRKDEELFKWFLASILFGARISEVIARHTYYSFKKYALLSPEKILEAGWDFLVNPVMREGGYVRYDEKTSSKILRICDKLIREYEGSLEKLHNLSEDKSALENRLLDFYGVGPVTVYIFLRELRPFWKKADPEPLPLVYQLARKLKIDVKDYDRKSIVFARIEAGLIRLRK